MRSPVAIPRDSKPVLANIQGKDKAMHTTGRPNSSTLQTPPESPYTLIDGHMDANMHSLSIAPDKTSPCYIASGSNSSRRDSCTRTKAGTGAAATPSLSQDAKPSPKPDRDNVIMKWDAMAVIKTNGASSTRDRRSNASGTNADDDNSDTSSSKDSTGSSDTVDPTGCAALAKALEQIQAKHAKDYAMMEEFLVQTRRNAREEAAAAKRSMRTYGVSLFG
ncbi:hypothetical protein HOO65_020360 [Ceratocystis lukuohia]|uniref:Uncharacterized protein n=2 Tax=Ceratocystis TaxID=5157 RepID=A0A0F8D229_CERFI|nr:hypothetical protein CFO_g873 [Ceratocystis platani]